MNQIIVLSGSSCRELSAKICKQLKIELGDVELSKKNNKETFVQINDFIRNKHVFIIQSGSGNINDNVMELLQLIHASKILSAGKITAVIPFFPYSCPENEDKIRPKLSSKLIAKIIEASGADHVITMDLHFSQIQGYFDIPLDNIYPESCFLEYIRNKFSLEDLVLVSPDISGTKRVSAYADELKLNFVITHRDRLKANGEKTMILVGNVSNKVALIIDDVVDSAATLVQASKKLVEEGAKCVFACVTHCILSGSAVHQIEDSLIEEVIVTDTVEHNSLVVLNCKKIKFLTVSHIFARAIEENI